MQLLHGVACISRDMCSGGHVTATVNNWEFVNNKSLGCVNDSNTLRYACSFLVLVVLAASG